MTKYTDNLWSDLAREHGAALEQAGRPGPGRTRHPSPRVIAGSTLAVAAVGAAVTVGLTSTASTPTPTTATTAAFTVTESASGSVLVTLNQTQAIGQADQKLAEMGIHEKITIYMASGAAAVSGPVTCTPAPGISGPTVKVLVGTNGTQVIRPTGGNTGVGTWHLASCSLAGDTGGTGVG